MDSYYDLNQLVKHDGQSDTLMSELPRGAFVFPAMFVAHLGRGSSNAGHEYLESLVPETEGKMKDEPGAWKTYPVKLARDEHVYMPDQVEYLGNGDINEGAKLLEAWVHAMLGEEVGHKVED